MKKLSDSEKQENQEIKIYVSSVSPYDFSLLMLSKNNRKRIKFVSELNNANYLVTNHYYQEGQPSAINLELSKKFKISRERIRQIENKAFEKLQKHMLNSAKSKNLLSAN